MANQENTTSIDLDNYYISIMATISSWSIIS